jgi:hypothetical protein
MTSFVKELPSRTARNSFAWRSFDRTPLLILLGPLLLFVFPTLPFQNNGNCDPWYVYGLLFNLPEYLHWEPGARQMGRLAGILPGYLLNQVFTTTYFDYAQFLLFYTVSVVFIYKTAVIVAGKRQGTWAALFFALSPIVIGNYAVTFAGPAITYEVLSLYCVARALCSPGSYWRLSWMGLSGIALGAAINAHLSVLPFSLISYLFFSFAFLLDRKKNMRARIETVCAGALCVAVGIAAISCALGLLNLLAFGGRFSIIFNQLNRIPRTLENNLERFIVPNWYLDGPMNGMYLLGLSVALVCFLFYGFQIFAKKNFRTDRLQRFALISAYLVTFPLLIVGDMFGGIFLEYEYYSVFLWPFLALVIFTFEFNSSRLSKIPTSMLFFSACLVALLLKQHWVPGLSGAVITSTSILIAISAASLIGAATMVSRETATIAICLTYLAVISSTCLVVRPMWFGGQLWTEEKNSESRKMYERVHVGLKYLHTLFGLNSGLSEFPKFWIDPNVQDGLSYARSFLWCKFNEFPNVDPKLSSIGQGFKSGETVVIVARPQNLTARVIAAFKELHLETTVVGSLTINDDVGPYDLLVTIVTARK